MTTDLQRADDERAADEVTDRIAELRREAKVERDHWRRPGPFRTFAVVAGLSVAAGAGAGIVSEVAPVSPGVACFVACFQTRHNGGAISAEMYDDSSGGSSSGGAGTIRADVYEHAAGGSIGILRKVVGPYTSGGSNVF